MTTKPKQWAVRGGDGLWWIGTPYYENIRSTSLRGARRVVTAVNEHDSLVAAVESVRALHRRVTLREPLGVFPICAVCVGDEQFGQVYYPCPTIAAIDAAMLPND